MATWTQEDIDKLKAAIASGVLSVTYNGPPARSVTYQSLAAMRSLLAEMTADVARQAGAKTTRRAKFRKGFDS
jgi:hypothetical protein